MAQIAFSALGQAAGSALLPSGIGALGFQVSGAAIGQAIGGFVGSRLDGLIFGNTTEGARIESVRVMESREGAGIANVYGRARIGGQVIWAAVTGGVIRAAVGVRKTGPAGSVRSRVLPEVPESLPAVLKQTGKREAQPDAEEWEALPDAE